MKVLVTGGAGYLGSHTCVELLMSGYEVVIVDSLVNSKQSVLSRIKLLTGKKVGFHHADIRDEKSLEEIISGGSFDAVINFAGLKAVGESVEKPLDYYYNNVSGAITLCRIMEKYNVKNLIFSSSATVYGQPNSIPVAEHCPNGNITNPYGQTKAMIEQILMDTCNADPEWNVTMLRYFNPIGAHESGLLGEDPRGIPNNLLPYVAQVAAGKREYVGIFGDDYPTPDGTGVRDYIHVVDLAKAHVKAIEKLRPGCGMNIYNIGTGKGYSVLEVIKAYEKACGKKLPYKMLSRRAGDIVVSYCDATKAKEELGWMAEKSLDDMCVDSWRWQSMNPDGYED